MALRIPEVECYVSASVIAACHIHYPKGNNDVGVSRQFVLRFFVVCLKLPAVVLQHFPVDFYLNK